VVAPVTFVCTTLQLYVVPLTPFVASVILTAVPEQAVCPGAETEGTGFTVTVVEPLEVQVPPLANVAEDCMLYITEPDVTPFWLERYCTIDPPGVGDPFACAPEAFEGEIPHVKVVPETALEYEILVGDPEQMLGA
jgi:hypothetical protein